jgi:hypothetical protein
MNDSFIDFPNRLLIYCPIDGGIQSTYNFNVLIQEEANA